jgi:HlyD family secretion protein
MNKKKLIPLTVVTAALIISVLYFEIFRHLGGNSDKIEGTGTIEVTEIDVSTKISGRVISLPKEEGEKVEKNELIAKIEYDELDAQKQSIIANLSNARTNMQRVRQLFNQGSVSKKDFDNMLMAFKVAQANYDRINAAIENAVIFSPIKGVVLERNLEVGETSFPGTPIMTIADLSKPWINIYVPEKKLGFVKLGQKAEVYIDTYPDKSFKGKVTAISNKAEFTPKTIQTKDERVKLMFAVKISVENLDLVLKPGMPADANIILENKK